MPEPTRDQPPAEAVDLSISGMTCASCATRVEVALSRLPGIESAQVKVEGFNFDIRKHLLEYDEVINEQRRVIYDQRTEILRRDDLRDVAWPMIEQEVEALVAGHTASPDRAEWDLAGLALTLRSFFPLPEDEDPESWKGWTLDELTGHLLSLAKESYEAKEARLGPDLMHQLERAVMLRVIDQWWVRHLTAVDELPENFSCTYWKRSWPAIIGSPSLT